MVISFHITLPSIIILAGRRHLIMELHGLRKTVDSPDSAAAPLGDGEASTLTFSLERYSFPLANTLSVCCCCLPVIRTGNRQARAWGPSPLWFLSYLCAERCLTYETCLQLWDSTSGILLLHLLLLLLLLLKGPTFATNFLFFLFKLCELSTLRIHPTESALSLFVLKTD